MMGLTKYMSKMENMYTKWKTAAITKNRARDEPAMALKGWARLPLLPVLSRSRLGTVLVLMDLNTATHPWG